MCDQRERLIGYVYDECEPGDRAAVQQHLESCEECRREIAALRSVRVDLQAWDVPYHESVWKPFAPAPAASWWSQIPRWAMAAAASMVVASGAAGGAVSYALMRGQPVQAAPAGAVQVGPAVTINHLDALERRLEGRIAREVDQLNTRVQLVGSRQITPELAESLHKVFDQQLAELSRKSDEQFEVIRVLHANLGQYQKTFDTRQALIKQRVENLALAFEQGGGRQ